ncbi:hypothetical protein TSTA_109530 [Talaromyces stipitatus ATCC 10500]|uniref:Fungal death-pathway protein SesB domain-containing protein n=1 Tax=Talaromyces stipitatus (strain ATCC 10500 / CBS 375.48 / QM 6759 / NRRL 1006) TaxID=441959 RepID=B8MU56_TALSN|nr:uncharacterized protein TSTA_109530 [Talaromyces stipitatus ATCC 10500]EED11774.1 hypothetical protein TSTA_109530 [Talaromyces stipitatus ATCC 10500]
MPPAEYHTTFSNSTNYRLQVGNNTGNIETHHHYAATSRVSTTSVPIDPVSRNPDFVARGTILNQLHHQRAAPGSWTALVGLGGAGNASQFEQSYQDIANAVKILGRRDPKVNIFKLVHDWLRDSKNGKWILILDNIDDVYFLLQLPDIIQGHAGRENGKADRPLREYLPQSWNGSILITSRNREATLKLVDQRNIIALEPMDKEDARALFEKKLGKGQ